MAEHSAIEWCDHTFNPWIGCTQVSPGCDGCYAMRSTPVRVLRARGFETWGTDANRFRSNTWGDPLRWNKRHDAFFAEHGRRQRVFCASLADVFDNEVPEAWRFDLLNLIADTPNLDWLLLTKRIGNAKAMLDAFMQSDGHKGERWDGWRNVWLGATVVNQAEADRDIPKLLAVPAAVHFLSVEPMLGPVDLERPMPGAPMDQGGGSFIYPPWYIQSGIDWVICGGESGPKARPMHPDWARSLRDQCAAAGVPFLFKQWGEFLPASADEADPTVADVPASRLFWSDGTRWDRHDGQRGGVDLVARVGTKAAGRLLDGRAHNGFPAPTKA